MSETNCNDDQQQRVVNGPVTNDGAFFARWVPVSERIPDCEMPKQNQVGWLVWNGEQEYYTRQHPDNWNKPAQEWHKMDAGYVVVEWLEFPAIH